MKIKRKLLLLTVLTMMLSSIGIAYPSQVHADDSGEFISTYTLTVPSNITLGGSGAIGELRVEGTIESGKNVIVTIDGMDENNKLYFTNTSDNSQKIAYQLRDDYFDSNSVITTTGINFPSQYIQNYNGMMDYLYAKIDSASYEAATGGTYTSTINFNATLDASLIYDRCFNEFFKEHYTYYAQELLNSTPNTFSYEGKTYAVYLEYADLQVTEERQSPDVYDLINYVNLLNKYNIGGFNNWELMQSKEMIAAWYKTTDYYANPQSYLENGNTEEIPIYSLTAEAGTNHELGNVAFNYDDNGTKKVGLFSIATVLCGSETIMGSSTFQLVYGCSTKEDAVNYCLNNEQGTGDFGAIKYNADVTMPTESNEAYSDHTGVLLIREIEGTNTEPVSRVMNMIGTTTLSLTKNSNKTKLTASDFEVDSATGAVTAKDNKDVGTIATYYKVNNKWTTEKPLTKGDYPIGIVVSGNDTYEGLEGDDAPFTDSTWTYNLTTSTASEPTISTQPAAQEVTEGTTATFSVAASTTDGGTLSYQWYKKSSTDTTGTAIENATSSSYSITSPELSDSGNKYYCVVTNTLDGTTKTVTTNEATLTVTSGATATSISMKSNPTKTTYSVGDVLDLTGAKITVKYDNNTTKDVDVTSSMVSGFDSSSTGTKTVTVTYKDKTTTFNVTVGKATPAAPTGLTGVMCATRANNDGKITGLDSSKLYQYSTNATSWTDVVANSTEITGLKNGTYYVRLKETDTTKASSYATVTVDSYVNENAKDISTLDISNISNQTYTGSAITPELTIKDGEKTLVKDTDYTVTYKNNINPGTATVTIKGMVDYKNSKDITFTIDKKATSTSDVVYDETTNSYKAKTTGIGTVTTYYSKDKTTWSSAKPTDLGETYYVGFSIAEGTNYAAFGSSSDVKTEDPAKSFVYNPKLVNKDTKDFDVKPNGSAYKEFTKAQTSESTIHIDNLALSNVHTDSNKYTGILVMNGTTVLTEGTDYTISSGSVKVNLTKKYLDTLDVGTHTINVYVSKTKTATSDSTGHDYEFVGTVKINAAQTSGGTGSTGGSGTRYKVVNTGVEGVNSNNSISKVVGLISLVTLAGYAVIKKKEN